jgi:hypothetical protein
LNPGVLVPKRFKETASWPEPFEPQQYAASLVVTPQIWAPPTLTVANVRLPGTGVGAFPTSLQQYAAPLVVTPKRPLSSPRMRSPASGVGAVVSAPKRPQQYAAPLAVKPQGGPFCALSIANVRPPRTASGRVLHGLLIPNLASTQVSLLVAPPSRPFPLAPQQYAWPDALRAHDNTVATATVVMALPPPDEFTVSVSAVERLPALADPLTTRL